MKARYMLVACLKATEHIKTEDPLHYTKQFLHTYNISEKLFFEWIVREASEWGSTIESDRAVRIFLQ